MLKKKNILFCYSNIDFSSSIKISKVSGILYKRITRFDIFRQQELLKRNKRDDNYVRGARGLFVDDGNVSCCVNNWHGCPHLSRSLFVETSRDDTYSMFAKTSETKMINENIVFQIALEASRFSLVYTACNPAKYCLYC